MVVALVGMVVGVCSSDGGSGGESCYNVGN